MEPQIKKEMQQFFAEFWSRPGNIAHFEEGADKRVKSANCRLARGNVAAMSNFIVTRREIEEWCRTLQMPVLEFGVVTE